MAKVHLVTGPSGNGKTHEMLERYIARAREHPGTALWLSPTTRSVERVRCRLVDQIGGGWGLHLETFEGFVDQLVRWHDALGRSLRHVQRRMLLEEVVARLHAEGELPSFEPLLESRGFALGLFGLIDELKRMGVSCFEFVRAAYRRGYRGDSRANTIGDLSIGHKDREFGRIYARYQLELRRRGFLDEEGRFRRALELIRANSLGPFSDVTTVFVDGFVDLSPAQQRLLVTWAETLDSIHIALLDETDSQREELFDHPRSTAAWLDESFDIASTTTPAEEVIRPAGLRHLERQLFLPLRKVEQSDTADGLVRVQAPGVVGEARLVARRIKRLLLDGVPADSILVTARDIGQYSDLLDEVFAEYGIPTAIESATPLARNPLVSAFARSLRLPEDDWPFRSVTALLRNTYFRPEWDETAEMPDIADRAEALLRLLGEPRGRDAYLASVERWADQQQPGLEDEQAEESRRRKTHELAGVCRPFLRRFFAAWDDAPTRAPVADHIDWMKTFATRVGFDRIEREPSAPARHVLDTRDLAAWQRLWEELTAWQQADRDHSTNTIPRRVFLNRLTALIGETSLARPEPPPRAVQVLAAESGRHLKMDYVFVLGLGERSFPKLTTAQPFFDEDERHAFRDTGIPLTASTDRLPGEMLLFYQIVTSAQKELVLCYPAVDQKGQELLPSSFLDAVTDCFGPNAIPTERREMLIEAYDRDEPLSLAEYRVRAASVNSYPTNSPITNDVRDNLADARFLQTARLHTRTFTVYDGLFSDPSIIAELSRIFGPERIFSPTALEDYVACPFKFYARHLLRLEPLEEPREEIEVTRRGQAVHRALARLHENRKRANRNNWDESIREEVQTEIQTAVDEDIDRAPSPAAKQLWRLEGQRLLEVTKRYPDHWAEFQEPWLKLGVVPEPYFFEIDFGLPVEPGQTEYPPLVLRNEECEVRISGRIDRVDCAQLDDGPGYWIIDYKTGRASNYTSPDLAEFRKLQLTLYAMAVEEVLFEGKNARPLGLAYWMVGEKGAKVCLPARGGTKWMTETKSWQDIRERLQAWILEVVTSIRAGIFPLEPAHPDCTVTCSFGQMCRITQARATQKEETRPRPE